MIETFKEQFETVSIEVDKEKAQRAVCQEGLLNLVEEMTSKLTQRATF